MSSPRNRFLFQLLSAAVLTLAVSFAQPGFAADAPAAGEGAKVAAPSKAEAIKASDAANAKTAPGKETAAAKKDEAAPAEKPLSPEEKAAAISAADALTAYDQSKVIGRAREWQYYYQPAESPVMEKLEGLHDFVFAIISVIVTLVLGLLGFVCLRFSKRANPTPHRFSHNTVVEIVWTTIPILILVAIGIPSLRVHYAYSHNQEIIDHPDLTLKVVGHQWYWTYEYPDQGITFDSNITKDKDLKPGEPRLLTVDNPIVVPVGKVVRVQVTGADVIHSWAMPSFGVKQDGVPGRLNETWFKANKEGIYYGQCSELCGKFHGFMPIEVIVVSPEQFDIWVKGAKQKFANNDAMQFAANQ